MKYIECKFCGARLILGAEVPAPEVRCKRCGRNTPTDRAKTLQSDTKPQRQPVPIVAPAPPRQPQPEPRAPEQPRYVHDPVRGVLAGTRGLNNSPPPGATRARTLGLVALVMLVLAGGSVSIWMAAGGNEPKAKSRDSVTKIPLPPPQQTQQGVGSAPTGATVQAGTTAGGGSAIGVAAAPNSGPTGATPPPIQGQPRTRSRFGPTDGLAAQIDLDLLFNKVIYVNTEIALKDVEQERLHHAEPKQCSEWFVKYFAGDATPDPRADAKRWTKLTEDDQRNMLWFACIQTLQRVQRLLSFRLGEPWLYDHRPALSVLLRNVPKDTKVKLALRVTDKDSDAQQFLSKPQATANELVALRADEPGVWWSAQHNAWEVGLEPQWNERALVKIQNDQRAINVELQAWYYDESGQVFRESTVNRTIRLAPANHVELEYPLALGAAGLASESHPSVLAFINKLDRETIQGLRAGGAGSTPGENLMSMFFVWRELRRRGLSYSSISSTPNALVQEVRSVHDSLAAKNANCLDGSVLMAGIFRKLGLKVQLVSAQAPGLGHALLQVDCNGLETGLETTALERNTPCDDKTLDIYLRWYENIGAEDRTLKSVYEHMNATEMRDFRIFLQAVKEGDDFIRDLRNAMLSAVGKGYNLTTVPALFQQLKLIEKTLEDSELDPKNPIWNGWPAQYELIILDLRSARGAGVVPIPAPEGIVSPKSGL